MGSFSFLFCLAKFNHSVQGTVDNNITSEPTITAMTTLTVTSQVTDLSTTSPMKGITTADSNTDMPLSASDRTDGSDLITTTAETVKTNRINDHGLQVGSFQYYIVVAAGSIVAVVALIAIVILIKIYIRNKKFKVSLEVVQRISRWRQRSRNLNIHVKETPSADISILPESDVDLTPAVESSSLEPPILSPPSESFADHEIIQEADRDRSLPPRKCDRIPVYIFLGPRESDPPIPKSPIECKQNLAYLHLGPEDNSTAASLQRKPITCKKNAAYIHLDPEDTSK